MQRITRYPLLIEKVTCLYSTLLTFVINYILF